MKAKGTKNFKTDEERDAAALRRKETRKKYLSRPEIRERTRAYEKARAEENKARAKAHYAKNPKLMSLKQKKFRATPKGRATHLINAARKRARISGVEVSVPLSFVEGVLVMGACMRTGIKFDFGAYGSRAAFAPSLDRKNPIEGYTLENTEVVCNAFNMAKNEWDYKIMVIWIEAVRAQDWYKKLLK